MNARHIAGLTQKLRPEEEHRGWWVQEADVLRAEVELLQHLDFNLLVFHCYGDIERFVKDAEVPDALKCAFAVANDSYRTDLCLVHPPHIIALACVRVAAQIRKCAATLNLWLSNLDTDHGAVDLAVAELHKLYDPKRKAELELCPRSCVRLLSQSSLAETFEDNPPPPSPQPPNR